MRRIALMSIGTEGDVRPLLVLGTALKERGYSVVIGAPEDFEESITNSGLEFCNLCPSIKSFLTQPNFETYISNNKVTNIPSLMRQARQTFYEGAKRAWKMSQGADAVIYTMNTSFGIDIAEALNVPAAMAGLQPMTETGEYALCIYGSKKMGSFLNRLSYFPMNFQQMCYNGPRNRARQEIMGLGKVKNGQFLKNSAGEVIPTLYAFSEALTPRPKDWPENAVVTGYWRSSDTSNWKPSEEFKKFLSEGKAPVYIGFGSIPFGANRNTRIVREALQLWGGRAIVALGWGGIHAEELKDNPNVFAIEKAPHDKLFSYVHGVVHHGGAGSTCASLIAAQPTFVIPQVVDQPFWGSRVFELGCGPKPIRLSQLKPKTLADSLQDLTENPAYKRAAQEVSEKLKQENGTSKAIEAIGQLIVNNQNHKKAA